MNVHVAMPPFTRQQRTITLPIMQKKKKKKKAKCEFQKLSALSKRISVNPHKRDGGEFVTRSDGSRNLGP